MDQKAINSLKKQRASNKGRLSQVLTFLTNADETTPIEDFRTRLSRVEKLMMEFTEIETSLFNLDPEQESDVQYEENYYKAITGLNTWIRTKSTTLGISCNLDTSMNATQSGSGHAEIKLPKINIPTFSGEYTEWQSFFDLYCSTIHDSPSLDPVQKFQYLKGLLRGEPAVLLRHITVTEANYLGALNKLKERYHRKRPIINSFIRTFIEQPSVHTANSNNIKRIMDTSDEVIRGLKALGDSAEARDPWLIFILLDKLDPKSKAQWAETTADQDTTNFTDFLKFLARRIDTLESINVPIVNRTNRKQPLPAHIVASERQYKCAMCTGDHSIFQCQQFNAMDVIKRRDWVITNKRCFNCLSTNHLVFKCTSRRRCYQCRKSHHSLLHMVEENEDTKKKEPDALNQTALSSCVSCLSSVTILPTAIINVVDSVGQIISCRALLDSGSQVSFITEACSQRLNLPRKNARLTVCGIGQTKAGLTKGVVSLVIKPENSPDLIIKALVLSKITSRLPPQNLDHIDTNTWQGTLADPNFNKLADPNFNKSSQIDVLIGADYFFKILEEGQIKVSDNKPILQKTIFGWVVAGTIHTRTKPENTTTMISTNELTLVDIDRTLRQFWEIESIMNISKSLSPEEQLCEDTFLNSLEQNTDGRFAVSLPFKQSPNSIGCSMSIAIQRQHSMERRFARQPEFYKMYQDFMLEYENLNHMEEIPPEQINDSGFYLPHHGVLRYSSTTTRLRVVFDGSAKSSSGIALNDCLAVGPTIQSTLYSILLRFREHPFVFSADVEKMYRQVRIHKNDTNYQKIVWRKSPADQMRHYRLLTVTYGLSSAPFLATRVLKKISEDHHQISFLAANAVGKDVYVDDLMTGANSENEALQLKETITHILQTHGFKLRKWSSNSMALLNTVNSNDRMANNKEIKNNEETSDGPIKVLGVRSIPSNDEFTFVYHPSKTSVLTKRTILSEAGRCFDPLGWIAPINTKIKVFIQQLWMLNLNWDDPLPKETKEWKEIQINLPNIEKITIPRFVHTDKSTRVEIHGFCDASQVAYAAVVYYRAIAADGTVQTSQN